MKRLPLFILIPILILFCSIVHVQAASGLICGISISGDNISKNYNFSPGVSEYTIYVLSPGTINIDIQAANDDTLLTANGQQSLGQLSLSKELAKEKTVISITARNGQTQTVSITFILRKAKVTHLHQIIKPTLTPLALTTLIIKRTPPCLAAPQTMRAAFPTQALLTSKAAKNKTTGPTIPPAMASQLR